MRVLLTGAGDIANALEEKLKDEYFFLNPTKGELDVADKSSVSAYFKKIGSIDVVVNLAGTLYSSSIIESDTESWIRDINVNLVGTYLVNRESIMSNPNVKIINVSSTAAYNSYFDWSSYCASKAGVIKISNALAIEGYDVTTLCPGAIDTKIRNGLSINNTNVMSIEESLVPVINALKGKYQSGDIILYRKNELKTIREI
ncbi:clavaldehyde dehydrogenase [Vibrio cyclitrophicus]|nr:clavaldehyde dehydrogenase [Vibrio cyclitrophicus]